MAYYYGLADAERAGNVNLEEYTSSVLWYIKKCVEDVTTAKTFTIHPNKKPWLRVSAAEVVS